MQLLIIGAGYVGLVTGACFAEMGHNVICLDIDHSKVEQLKKGNLPIYEPGLKEIVERNIKTKRLSFTTNYQEAVEQALICFIAVNTPANEDGSANLQYVKSAASNIASCMPSYRLIVNKSTVPIGTGDLVSHIIEEKLKTKNLNIDFDVVSNPEFLKEGNAINDCMKPDRVVFGCNSKKASQLMKTLYSSFNLNHDRILEMDVRSAEMTKYAANAMLATRISFMNEIASICEETGADIGFVRKGIGSDPRIGYHFLYAGAGYGGSCFPKDIQALRSTASNFTNCKTALLDAVDEVNNHQKTKLGKKIIKYFSKKNALLKGKTIAILGLSFKPDTDDMREAPSLTLIHQLIKAKANVKAFDPIAIDNAKKWLSPEITSQITWCQDEISCTIDADAVVLITEWKQFRMLNFNQMLKVMKGNAFFDGRNQYSPQEMKEIGFDYFCFGKPNLPDLVDSTDESLSLSSLQKHLQLKIEKPKSPVVES